MTTYLGKSCSFCLPRVPFVNCRQFMYLVISLLVLRAEYGIWLYQFLIIAYLFYFAKGIQNSNNRANEDGSVYAIDLSKAVFLVNAIPLVFLHVRKLLVSSVRVHPCFMGVFVKRSIWVSPDLIKFFFFVLVFRLLDYRLIHVYF